ncbi:MAG: NADH-quinone oxidoreductase subunit C [Ignavibacteriales bacterium]|nr:NADH-quinone oxidoreductase subunit C [Ignavibacteriales bacterium]
MNAVIIDKLQARFGKESVLPSEFRDELTIVVPKNQIVDICRFLKEDAELKFDFLMDLCGIDMNTPENRFGVIYNIYSLTNKFRLRLKTFTEEADLKVPTVTGVWGTANWHERETFDMFGVVFEGHPDLRRVYMPEDFEHFPLRKDFPLMGIPGSIPLPKNK